MAEAGPRYFTDAAGRVVFGWLHAPAGAPRGLVVLCPPIGYDAICSHASLRALAERLAAAGHLALRVDYHGTGDAAGCDRDPERVPAWLASVAAAVAHARAAVPNGAALPVTLFGVRLGATLALAAAAQATDGLHGVDGLILWSPPATGRAWVREVRAFRKLLEAELGSTPARADLGRGPDDEESAGFLLSAETIATLSAVDSADLAKAPCRHALVIGRDDLPGGEDKLVRRLSAAGVDVSARAARGYAAMMQDPHKAVLPHAVFDEVLDWLGAASPSAPRPAAAGPAVRLRAAAGTPEVSEQPLFLGPRQLFAVATAPAAATPPADERPVVVFLNAGAIYHIGPNRMAVTLARAWAARGFTSVRVDLAGLGDSPPALRPATSGGGMTGLAEGVAALMYSTAVVADVREVLTALAARGLGRRFVLVGLCSGAYVAYHSSLDAREVLGQVLINPQTFAFREGDSLDVASRSNKNYAEARRYRRTLFKPEAWQKALRGQVDFRYIAGVLTRRVRTVVETRAGRVLAQLGLRAAPGQPLIETFRALGARGTTTFMVFSGDDPGLGYVEERLGPRLASLRGTRGVHLDVIDGPDHTFTPLWSQVRLEALLTERLESLRRLG